MDRSSEERSREWTPLVEVIRREMLARFSDKLSMEEIASCAYAVAALEDRQEAAPDEVAKDAARRLLAGVKAVIASGVPSEATPSKENAGAITPPWTSEQVHALNAYQSGNGPLGKMHPFTCGSGNRTDAHHKDGEGVLVATRDGWICPFCPYTQNWAHAFMAFAAPAPEVQGTPAKYPFPKNPCGKGIYREGIVRHCWLEVDHEGECRWIPASQIIPPVPVGTPQKETPPMPSMPYGTDAQNFGAVPEGVQGKEPQTFEQFWKVEKEALLARVVCGCSAGSTCDSSAVHVDKFAKEVFVSGEAAGRRSAITEIQEWAETWESGVCVTDTRKISAKCAELLEKTKC